MSYGNKLAFGVVAAIITLLALALSGNSPDKPKQKILGAREYMITITNTGSFLFPNNYQAGLLRISNNIILIDGLVYETSILKQP